MLYNTVISALAMTAVLSAPAFGQNFRRQANSSSGESLALNPANVQTGSEADGLAAATGVESGEAASATDSANFINFCTGKTLTNGLQVKTGSCNGIVMGDIPANTNMVSTIILNPAPGQVVAADETFNVTLQIANLAAGSFTNPDATYYAAPQALDNGNIIGHTHVTIQTLGDNLAPTAAPNPITFAFFKGINDAGNGQGLLAATVTGGLPAGSYRVCTMSSASNHQPVLMPVAQRGAQDDCTKFTVAGGSGASNTTSSSTTTTAAAVTTTTTAAAKAGKGGKSGHSGKGGKGGRKGSSNKGGRKSPVAIGSQKGGSECPTVKREVEFNA